MKICQGNQTKHSIEQWTHILKECQWQERQEKLSHSATHLKKTKETWQQTAIHGIGLNPEF